MSRDGRLDAVERTLRSLPGVVDVRFLDPELRERITELEEEAERNGAVGGLMPFTNKGVWTTLEREVALVMVVHSSEHMLGQGSRLVILVDERGNLLGEFVDEKRQQELRGREGVHFLSDDFVIYSDIEPAGRPFFILPEIEFQYLDEVEGVVNVTSGSVSTLSDDHIRKVLGHEGPGYWTHLVGFDLE